MIQPDLSCEINSLIANLYRGVQEASPWQTFLPQLERLLNADLVALSLSRPSPYHRGRVFVSNAQVAQRDQLVEVYAQEVAAIDPFVRLKDGQAITLHEHLGAAALAQHPFFTDFMQPRDYIYHLGLDVYKDDNVSLYIRAVRGEQGQDFGESEKQLINTLAPHLRNLIAQLDREEKLLAERNAYREVTAQLALGCILLSETGEIASLNQSAEQILAQADGLFERKGRLSCDDPALNRALQSISRSPAGAPINNENELESLVIPRRQQEQPLYLVAKPQHQGNFSSETIRAHRILLLHAPELQASGSHSAIGELLGLTPSETRLVIELANGLSLDEIAAKRSVSRNTLRTHLQRAFQKTGVNKQSSLVTLVLRCIASLNG